MIRRVLGMLGAGFGIALGIVVLTIAVLVVLLLAGWRGLRY